VQEGLVDESCDMLKPQSPYALSKLKSEEFLQSLDNLEFIILRFGTIFGYSIGMRFHTAVNKFIFQSIMRQPLTVWESAYEQLRPYLDLEDGIRAFSFIIKNSLFDRNIYNILTLNTTVKDIVNAIKKEVSHLEIGFVKHKIMNQLSYEVSNKKIIQKGFSFNGNLQESIKKTINILRNCNQ